jgi:hypothetical protein
MQFLIFISILIEIKEKFTINIGNVYRVSIHCTYSYWNTDTDSYTIYPALQRVICRVVIIYICEQALQVMDALSCVPIHTYVLYTQKVVTYETRSSYLSIGPFCIEFLINTIFFSRNYFCSIH